MADLSVTLEISKSRLETWLSGQLGVRSTVVDGHAVTKAIVYFLEKQGIKFSTIDMSAEGKRYVALIEDDLLVTLRGEGTEFERACKLVGQFSN